MSTCDRLEELRDYAMGELPADARGDIEKHAVVCPDCASELNSLRLTTAALRVLPDEEIPQRIGFVSDKVFEPSPVARWFRDFWNSAARLGFASACLLAVAITTLALRTPAPPVVQQPRISLNSDVSEQIDIAVAKAVAQVRGRDAQLTKAALDAAEARHQQEHQALMVAMEENMTVLQKRLSTVTTLASNFVPREDAGQ
jgi:hypothetical protein